MVKLNTYQAFPLMVALAMNEPAATVGLQKKASVFHAALIGAMTAASSLVL